jgi:hypothetical protein
MEQANEQILNAESFLETATQLIDTFPQKHLRFSHIHHLLKPLKQLKHFY